MKRTIFPLVMMFLCCVTTSSAQLIIEPLFKIGVYERSSEIILLKNGGTLLFSTDRSFDYYTTVGIRTLIGSHMALESENKITITTNNFIVNSPYLAEFYIRAYYHTGKIKAGIEHLCTHPVETGDIGLTHIVVRSYNEIYFSYGF